MEKDHTGKKMKNKSITEPVKPLRSLFGTLPDIDMKKISKDHNQEVELEDEDDRKARIPPV